MGEPFPHPYRPAGGSEHRAAVAAGTSTSVGKAEQGKRTLALCTPGVPLPRTGRNFWKEVGTFLSLLHPTPASVLQKGHKLTVAILGNRKEEGKK
jgi:hypothetical protein